jgi:hypothetical protein
LTLLEREGMKNKASFVVRGIDYFPWFSVLLTCWYPGSPVSQCLPACLPTHLTLSLIFSLSRFWG